MSWLSRQNSTRVIAAVDLPRCTNSDRSSIIKAKNPTASVRWIRQSCHTHLPPQHVACLGATRHFQKPCPFEDLSLVGRVNFLPGPAGVDVSLQPRLHSNIPLKKITYQYTQPNPKQRRRKLNLKLHILLHTIFAFYMMNVSLVH